MIGGIRKFAKSKWAAVLLFAPLIISFGIFGFQDPFNGISGGGLSRVGDHEIHARDLNEELSAQIEAIRQEDGRVLTQADAIREGIAQQVLAQLEYRNMILAYADKVGIKASKQAVADLLINRAGAFKDALGRFDELRVFRSAPLPPGADPGKGGLPPSAAARIVARVQGWPSNARSVCVARIGVAAMPPTPIRTASTCPAWQRIDTTKHTAEMSSSKRLESL